jgi:hypothetical protein
MVRRKAYTKVIKRNQLRPAHVKGMGDVAFKGFQCLNPECREFIFVRKDETIDSFEIECPTCHYVMRSGEESKFFDYDLADLRTDTVIESGEFKVLNDDYITEAQEYKYCLLCNSLKPLNYFDVHRSRPGTGRGECNLCKAIYNSIKNQTRLPDQHREAAEKRRLYMDLSGGAKIDSKVVFERFGNRCFKCDDDLSLTPGRRRLDHTLSVYYLWALTTDTATLLCPLHNGEKAERWPSEYYSPVELKRLSVITGIDHELLSGPPTYNPEALKLLSIPEFVDHMLEKFSAYMPEVIKLRNRVLRETSIDFFNTSSTISKVWINQANTIYYQNR